MNDWKKPQNEFFSFELEIEVKQILQSWSWWPLDLLTLLLQYIYIPQYKTACVNKEEEYFLIELGNDLSYSKIYKYENNLNVTYNNDIVGNTLLQNHLYEDSIWINHGKILVHMQNHNCIRIYDIIHNNLMTSSTLSFTDYPLISLKNNNNNALDVSSMNNIDCDSYYVYMETVHDIWLYSLKEKKTKEEEFTHLEDNNIEEISPSQRKSYQIAVNHDDEFFYVYVSWNSPDPNDEIWVYDKRHNYPSLFLDPPHKTVKIYKFEEEKENKQIICGFYVFNYYLYMIYPKLICIVSLPIIEYSPLKIFQTLEIGCGILLNTFNDTTRDDPLPVHLNNQISFTGEAACMNNQLYVVVENQNRNCEQICIFNI